MTTALQKVSRSVTIAEQSIEGKSPAAIAKTLGISKRTVYRDLETKEAKEIIELGSKVLTLKTVQVAENLNKLCDDKDKNIKLSAIKQHQKVTGIAPSNINNVYIDSIIQDNRQQVISSEVMELLTKGEPQVIDAVVED